MKNTKLIFSAFLIVSMSLIFSCGKGKNNNGNLQEVSPVKVERKDLAQRILFTGNILAEDAFDIYPRATGKVTKKLLKEGDPVKRDQPILLIERDEVGFSFKPMPVVSLIDGVIARVMVDVGTNVDLKDPVATVVRPGKVRVRIDVPERYLEKMNVGTEVSMEVDHIKGEKFTGKITKVSQYINGKTRTAEVEAEMPNDGMKLRHGMFGRLYLVIEEHKNALSIPNEVISWEGEKRFVYKIVDGKAVRTEITTGFRDNGNVEVLSGVAEGEILSKGSLLDLRDGEKVKIIENIQVPDEDEATTRSTPEATTTTAEPQAQTTGEPTEAKTDK